MTACGSPDGAAARGRRWRRFRFAGLAALIASLALPAVALAHPLGNFTLNHYAGLRVRPDEVLLDLVLDRAEIPTFQERIRLDTDGDGELSDAEAKAGRDAECASFDGSVELRVAGAALPLQLTASGLSFPPGAGGLATMRLVCDFRAALPGPLVDDTAVAFQDSSDSGRLGWREITVEGDGVTVSATGRDLLRTSPSMRLTAYPKDLLSQPLSISSVAFRATLGGPTLPPFVAPDAEPVSGPGGAAPSPGQPAAAATSGAAVPGGVGGTDIPSVFREPNLSPAIWLLALATAIALGAAHALTPGHGKTLVAAYLVATRGSALHAAGLGLSVTVSHTIGILVLAGLVVGAQGALPPDVVARTMPTLAALTIVGVGGWMLVAEVRRRRGAHVDHEHSHDGDHGHEHDARDSAHMHVPASRTITWRGLAVLGLAGGIIPSTSALLILLGTIAAGRPLFGVVLVVAFGVGMALVLTGVGLVLVRGRGWLERRSVPSSLRRLAGGAPLAASVLIVCVGLWLTAQAVAGRPVL